MIQHRTVPPAPSSWALGAQYPATAAVIPAPRPPYGPPPARPRPYPGPPVPEVQIRPRLLWVGLSWLLFGVLVLAGVATFVTGSTGAGSGPDRFFGGGEVVALELDPAADPLIYAALDSGGYVTCEPVGRGAGSLLLTPTTTEWSVVVGGQEWHAAFHLDPAVAGTYQIMCAGAGASFAVGDQADVPGLGGATLALVVLPLVGLVTAMSTTIVVLARRRAAQDRLLAPWTGGAAWPAQRW